MHVLGQPLCPILTNLTSSFVHSGWVCMGADGAEAVDLHHIAGYTCYSLQLITKLASALVYTNDHSHGPKGLKHLNIEIVAVIECEGL